MSKKEKTALAALEAARRVRNVAQAEVRLAALAAMESRGTRRYRRAESALKTAADRLAKARAAHLRAVAAADRSLQEKEKSDG